MARVQADPKPGQAALDALPDPWVVIAERAIAGEIQVNSLVRPGGCEVHRAGDRGGPTTDDDHGCGGGQAIVCGVQISADVGGRLQGRPAPEAVADPGRDDQRVVVLDERRAVVSVTRHFPRGQVHSGQRALDDPHPVQAAESIEGDPVVTGPIPRARQSDTELLTADQARFHRNTDDVEMFGEPDRGENADIAQARDDDAFAAHAKKL